MPFEMGPMALVASEEGKSSGMGGTGWCTGGSLTSVLGGPPLSFTSLTSLGAEHGWGQPVSTGNILKLWVWQPPTLPPPHLSKSILHTTQSMMVSTFLHCHDHLLSQLEMLFHLKIQKEGWRNISISRVLDLSSVPQHPHKCWVQRCMPLIPVLENQRQENPWGLLDS